MTSDLLLRTLLEFLRIPSVSSGGGDAAALQAGADWVAAQIVAAGGTARLLVTDRNPLVVGELAASRPGAPTVILYGHYDVQSAEPLDEWTTPPFGPEVRDGRVYGRGATDDKGQVLPLIWAARELAAAGELPVNVRFLVDGEEEIGGPSAEYWLRGDDGPADAAIAFDSRMPDPRTPILVTSGARHDAPAGGRANGETTSTRVRATQSLNAAHVLQRVLAAVLPDAAGKLPTRSAPAAAPDRCRAGGWRRLPGGATDIAQLGGRPHDAGAVDDRYRRNRRRACHRRGRHRDWRRAAGADADPADGPAMLSMRLGARPGERRDVAGPGADAVGGGAGRRRRAGDAQQRVRAGARRPGAPGHADRRRGAGARGRRRADPRAGRRIRCRC